MSKQHKIKRYHKKMKSTYKSGPSFASIALSIVGIVGLLFVGISIFDPVKNLILGNLEPSRQPPPLEEPVVSGSSSEAEDGGEENPAAVVVDRSARQMVYLPQEILRDEGRMSTFLGALEGTAVNTVLVDIKDSGGTVLFRSANENPESWEALSPDAFDLRALADRLAQSGLSLAVRMHTFRDPLAARGNRDNAVRYQDSDWLWLDGAADAGGMPWLNPYAPGARQYLTDLALEAVEAGAVFVLLEDVRFPDGSQSDTAGFGAEASGVTRQQALKSFVREFTAAMEAEGARAGIYVSAITTTQTATHQTRYGGNPLELADNLLVLGLLPYQFSEDHDAEGLVVTAPLRNPVDTVRTCLEYVRGRISGDMEIVPLLQGGSENGVTLLPATVQEQVDLVREAGSQSYILYHNGGSYTLALEAAAQSSAPEGTEESE